MGYASKLNGFKGHIILDHNQYNFIDKAFFSTGPNPLSGDKPDIAFPTLSSSFSSPDDVANFAFSAMPDDGRDLFLFLNIKHRVIATEPTRTWDHETAYQKMRANGAASVIYATGDHRRFLDGTGADLSPKISNSTRDVYFDILYIKDGPSYESANAKYGKSPGEWQSAMVDGKAPSWLFEPEGDYSVKNESHNIFFQEEKEEIRDYLESDPIAQTDIDFIPIFEKEKDLIEWAVDWVERNKKKEIIREDLGKITLTRRGFKDSISHGLSKEKAQGIATLPIVLKEGKIIYSGDKDGRESYVIAAPVRIGDKGYVELALLRDAPGFDDKRLYVHEVVIKEKTQGASKPADSRESKLGRPGFLIRTPLKKQHFQQTKKHHSKWMESFSPMNRCLVS